MLGIHRSCQLFADGNMLIEELLEQILPRYLIDMCQVHCNGKLVPLTCKLNELPFRFPVLRVIPKHPLKGGALNIDTFEKAKAVIDTYQEYFNTSPQSGNLKTFMHLWLKVPAREDVNQWRRLVSQWGLSRQKLAEMKQQCLQRFLVMVQSQPLRKNFIQHDWKKKILSIKPCVPRKTWERLQQENCWYHKKRLLTFWTEALLKLFQLKLPWRTIMLGNQTYQFMCNGLLS